MKNNFFLLFCVGLFYGNLNANAQFTSTAQWRKTPVNIDGKLNEWVLPLGFYDSKSKLMYDVAMDSVNLYVAMRFPEIETQLKATRGGLSMEVFGKASKKTPAKVVYPIGSGEAFQTGDNSQAEALIPDVANLTRQFKLKHNSYLCSGFSKTNGSFLIVENSSIRVAVEWDENGIMNYELLVPLSDLENIIGNPIKTEEDFFIVLTVNGMPKPPKGEEDAQMAPPMVPNGNMGVNGSMTNGGRMTGGMAQGMPVNSSGFDRDPYGLYSKSTVKQKIRFRNKP